MSEHKERLTLTVEEAGRLLGLSRPSAYEAASRGDLPTIRIGRRLLVPKAALEKMLGERPRGTATAETTDYLAAWNEAVFGSYVLAWREATGG